MFDDHGRPREVRPGPFTAVLEANGVDPAGLGVPRKRPKVKGRLKKWRCGCSVAWVVQDMLALCERCGQRYRRAGKADGQAGFGLIDNAAGLIDVVLGFKRERDPRLGRGNIQHGRFDRSGQAGPAGGEHGGDT